jgi:predicted DNA-binding protein
MIRTNVHLTPRQHDALRALAESTGLPLAEILRRAIDAYLARQPKEK